MVINPAAVMVIKSTIPVGFTARLRKELGCENLIFSPEFFRSRVFTDLVEFKESCDVILANRMVDELTDVMDKVYTRDLFGND